MNIDRETVNDIGVWVLRVGLLVGAIVSGMLGNTEVSGGCVTGLVCSFIFL